MLKKLSFALAAILSVSLLASCVINTSDDEKEDTHGIDYVDHSSGWSIMVTNETSQKLVLFYNAPSSNKIIGGVRAGDKNHHMATSTAVFGQTSSDFVMYAVKESDYLANKNTLEKLDSNPFATLYAYYNVDGSNDNVYTISKALGGNCYVTINNNSGYNVELRENGVNGPSIAYCGKGMYQQKYYWTEGDYLLFPVFRKFSKQYGEIMSVAPTKSNGNPQYVTFSLLDQDGHRNFEFDAKDWKGSEGFKFAPSASYLKVVNLSSQGISLYPGANASNVNVSSDGTATNSVGAKYISTAAGYNTLVYTFNLQQLGGTKTAPVYETQVQFANFKVGTPVERVKVKEGNQESFIIQAGHMLTLNVYDDENEGFRTEFAKDASTGAVLDYEVNFDDIEEVSVR